MSTLPTRIVPRHSFEVKSLCKGCHDSAGQKEDKGGGIIGCDANGIPLDPNSHWNK